VATEPWPASVPQSLHGVPGGCSHARASHQEGPPRAAQDGRQLPQVSGHFVCSSYNLSSWLHTHTHPFNSPLSGTTRVSRYQKGKTNLDFTEARDREWQWHQLGHMQICTSLQTNNHASTPPLSFLQARCPSCRPTNSVKALKAFVIMVTLQLN